MSQQGSDAMLESTLQSRRSMLKASGVAALTALSAVAPTSADSGSDGPEVTKEWYSGQRVTDSTYTDYSWCAVFEQADPSSEYLGKADGGYYNDPYGTAQGSGVYVSEYDVTMVPVDWDNADDPDGWCYANEIAPVNTY